MKARLADFLKRVATGPELSRKELWWVAAFFAALIAVAFCPVVFGGRSLVATDNLNPLDYRYSAQNYGPGFVPGETWNTRGIVPYANMADPGSAWWQGEPSLHFFRRAVLSGQMPFWDPSAAGGAPAYCNLTPSMLFPPQVLLSLSGATSLGKNIYILALFWVSGFGTYCVLRLHGVSVLAAATGGAGFLFSGAVQQIAHIHFMLQVVACMPLLLIGVRLFLDRPTWRRTSGLALLFGCVALASFPPLLVCAFGFALTYAALAIGLERDAQWKTQVLRLSAAGLLSLALVAGYYLPTFAAVGQATHITLWYQTAGLEILPPKSLFDLLSPTALGGPMVYSTPIIETAHAGRLYYVGAAALLLILLAFGRSSERTRPLIFASLLTAGFVLLKVFGVPPVQWIAYLPVFHSLHYALYFGIVVAFAFSLLAGLGLDRLLRSEVPALHLSMAAVLLAGGIGGLWLFMERAGALHHIGAWRWTADFRLLLVWSGCAAVFALTGVWRRNATHFLSRLPYLFLPLVCAEGVVNATYPRQQRWDVFAHPPAYVNALRALPPGSRGFIGSALNANLGSAFGINTLDSLYTFVSTRVFELYLRYTDAPHWVFLREAAAIPPETVLDRAGISWLAVRTEAPKLSAAALSRPYTLRYNDGYVRIFERPGATRVFFSSDYVVADRQRALELIASAPPRQLVFETMSAMPPQPNSDADGQPRIIRDGLNSMRIEVRAPRAGFLYVADTWDPGWAATVNGNPVPISIANYAFRAIPVPAGDAAVELRYTPKLFYPGVAVSFAALFIIGLVFCVRGKPGGEVSRGGVTITR